MTRIGKNCPKTQVFNSAGDPLSCYPLSEVSNLLPGHQVILKTLINLFWCVFD